MPHCPGWTFRMILILNHPQIGDRKVKRSKTKNLTAKKSDLERLASKRRWSLKPLVAIQQVLCFDAYIFWDKSKDLTETLNKGSKVGVHLYQMYFKTNYRKAPYKYHKLVIKISQIHKIWSNMHLIISREAEGCFALPAKLPGMVRISKLKMQIDANGTNRWQGKGKNNTSNIQIAIAGLMRRSLLSENGRHLQKQSFFWRWEFTLGVFVYH